jgi:predicted histidine transporter YuiF (NhaC family)
MALMPGHEWHHLCLQIHHLHHIINTSILSWHHLLHSFSEVVGQYGISACTLQLLINQLLTGVISHGWSSCPTMIAAYLPVAITCGSRTLLSALQAGLHTQTTVQSVAG